MKKTHTAAIAFAAVVLTVLGGMALAQQDKYTLKVPGGLAFSEFRGYEGWQVVSTSQSDKLVAVILANPVMIDAYLAGIPGNGKPFPDGAKMAKIHWNPLLPRLEILPRMVRSPVGSCFGTSPSQAPKSRPCLKPAPLPIAATMALDM